MKQYLALLETIMLKGNDRGDRTGTGTRSVFGAQLGFDLREGFPLMTTKKLPFKTMATELLWFLRGDTNIKYLLENNCHLWSADAYRMYKRQHAGINLTLEQFEESILTKPQFALNWGDLGPMYGKQWRQWIGGEPSFTTDQITNVINSIKLNPEGRRHIVTAWNPAEVDSMALPPCHCLFQFYVNEGRLSCHMYQRSADVFLGVPFNIASYALLTHIIAHQTGLNVGVLIISFGDVHIYNNHRLAVTEQISRVPYQLPELHVIPQIANVHVNIGEYMLSDFQLQNYQHYPPIKAELSVGV